MSFQHVKFERTSFIPIFGKFLYTAHRRVVVFGNVITRLSKYLCSLIWGGAVLKVWLVKLTKKKKYSKTLNATEHVVESSLML
jgi:hypothetical protein